MDMIDEIRGSEWALLEQLRSIDLRPNVLISTSPHDCARIAGALAQRLPGPIAIGTLPGDLGAPPAHGTWVLHDVAQMTRAEQERLAGWMTTTPGVRVISIASEPLWPLVTAGRFLDDLYYRLNVVVCESVRAADISTYHNGAAACRP
jgi:hypothetical protein